MQNMNRCGAEPARSTAQSRVRRMRIATDATEDRGSRRIREKAAEKERYGDSGSIIAPSANKRCSRNMKETPLRKVEMTLGCVSTGAGGHGGVDERERVFASQCPDGRRGRPAAIVKAPQSVHQTLQSAGTRETFVP